jgi:hypothetical protein
MKKQYLYKSSKEKFIEALSVLFANQKKFSFRPNFSGSILSEHEFEIHRKFEIDSGSRGSGGTTSAKGIISTNNFDTNIELTIYASPGTGFIFWFFMGFGILFLSMFLIKQDKAFGFLTLGFLVLMPSLIYSAAYLNKLFLLQSFKKHFDLSEIYE